MTGKRMNTNANLAVLGLCLLVGACGENPQQVAAPPPQPQANVGDVPISALGTTTAFSQFAASLPKTETGKPLDVDVNGVVPPTSETADPIPVL